VAASYRALAATLGGVTAHTNGNGRATGSRLGRLLGMGRKS